MASETRNAALRYKWLTVTEVRGGTTNIFPPLERALPMKLTALYQFQLSATKLQFDPRGISRVLPGVLVNSPGDPFRLNEREQFIGFTDYKVDLESDVPFLRIVPSEACAFGLLVSPTPVIKGPDSVLAATGVRVPDGTIGFSFYTTRKFEISLGFVLCYLEVLHSATSKQP